MKRKIYMPNNRPHTFIPRRDLFPEDNLDLERKGPSYPNRIYDKDLQDIEIVNKKPSAKTNADLGLAKKASSDHKSASDSTILILFLFGGLYLWPLVYSDKKDKPSAIQASIYDMVDNPKAIKLLESICPYLEPDQQDTVYTIIGIQDVLARIRDLMNRSYQKKAHSKSIVVPRNPIEKRIEMMKVLRPYVPDVSRESISNIVYVYDTYNKLNKNVQSYAAKRKKSKKYNIYSIEALVDFVDLISPVLPMDLKDKATKIITIAKLVEQMEGADSLTKRGHLEQKRLAKPLDQAANVDKDEKTRAVSAEEDKDLNDRIAQADRVKESLAPMLDEGQKESLDLIMKMAQLLARPDEKDR